jgi:hypothetical protein
MLVRGCVFDAAVPVIHGGDALTHQTGFFFFGFGS